MNPPTLSAALCLALLAACSGAGTTPAPEPKAAAPRKAGPPRITQFYLGAQPSGPGQNALVCYGVEGATAVRLAPPVEELSPSLARCFEVKVDKSIALKLTAVNRDGEEVSQELRLEVPKATAEKMSGNMIQFFVSPSAAVPAGGQAMLCYGVKDAVRVTLTPSDVTVEPKDRACVNLRVNATTNYVLTAYSASGNKDVRHLKIVAQ